VKSRFVLLLLFFTLNSFAQQRSPSDTLSPLRVVEKYISPTGFPEKLKYFCCELYQEWHAKQTLGQQLAPSVKREARVLFQDTLHAAVAVWLHDSITSMDVYFYLVKNQNWTIYAVRSLAMTDAATQEKKRLDSIPESARGKAYTKARGYSYTFEYANLDLWNSSDTVLAAYYHQHKKEFVSLQKKLVSKGYYGKSDSLLTFAMGNKKIKKQANKLLIRSIEHNPRHPGMILFIVGGMVDNTVGYFYQPDPSKVPPMTEKKYILIRPLGDGWYLFKTT
jgi:hypothetical protein